MSLKGTKYETQDEVKARLENTVVLYEGNPVYITKVTLPDLDDAKEIARVFFKTLPFDSNGRDKEVRKYLSSRNFDLTPFKMGYLNYKNEVLYLSRATGRQYKQGLCAHNLIVAPSARAKQEFGDRIPFRELLYLQEFVDMIKGVYPSFESACKQKEGSVAVSRIFSLEKDPDLGCFYLTHKDTKCGIVLQNGIVSIPRKFAFLKEALDDDGIKINLIDL